MIFHGFPRDLQEVKTMAVMMQYVMCKYPFDFHCSLICTIESGLSV